MTATHVHHTRTALADVRWHLRLARDNGEVPTDVARVLLAALARHRQRPGPI